jgi:hypothetical protein
MSDARRMCQCGDYEDEHDSCGCTVCRTYHGPGAHSDQRTGGPCVKFRPLGKIRWSNEAMNYVPDEGS